MPYCLEDGNNIKKKLLLGTFSGSSHLLVSVFSLIQWAVTCSYLKVGQLRKRRTHSQSHSWSKQYYVQQSCWLITDQDARTPLNCGVAAKMLQVGRFPRAARTHGRTNPNRILRMLMLHDVNILWSQAVDVCFDRLSSQGRNAPPVRALKPTASRAPHSQQVQSFVWHPCLQHVAMCWSPLKSNSSQFAQGCGSTTRKSVFYIFSVLICGSLKSYSQPFKVMA